MKYFNFIIVLIIFSVLGLSSCKKEETVTTKTSGDVGLDIEHVWGSAEEEFILNKEYTHPLTNDKMTFTIFRYYVSNLRLKSTDGTWFTQPDSYYIVDLGTDETFLSIPDVPGGEYTDIEVTFGVDSLHNVSGAQTGALAPSNSMFWSWNSGYIMLKAEGISPNSLTGNFIFHLGGFMGENKVQTTKTYNFGTTPLVIDGNREAEIHLVANPAKLWHSADNLATKSSMTIPGVIAKTMSSTFYNGIKFDHIHN